MSGSSVALTVLLASGLAMRCTAHEWPQLWNSYGVAFMDDQVRVIDRDAGDRTTSEGQAYAMFFALVANDRARFDALLGWTERNLASGDLTARLPAWLWGRDQDDRWGVLDANSASDADIWMAYTLLEAGEAWNERRYTRLGASLATRIAAEEVVEMRGFGPMLLPAPAGFDNGESYTLNASYLPLQLLVGLGQLHPGGPWMQIAARTPTLVRGSAPHGFVSDWSSLTADASLSPSSIGSYDAIRVYLWAGMLDPATPGRDALLEALPGMARHLRAHSVPPAKVKADAAIEDPKGPVGFSAALLPYLSALGEDSLESAQLSRVRSERNRDTGLYGRPARYYDQNLALFAIGFRERQLRFDAQGRLRLTWHR
jgi:endo-1,4-beta-D-glucanase Y